MTASKEKIKNDFEKYIKECGRNYDSWYVGISKDARDRLFNDHNVSEENGNWIYNTASSSQEARDIEEYFINTLGTDGGTGGGDEESDMVYSYKKTTYTNP